MGTRAIAVNREGWWRLCWNSTRAPIYNAEAQAPRDLGGSKQRASIERMARTFNRRLRRGPRR